MQRLWDILRGTHLNLVRLELHIPAPIYTGDEAMLESLPGIGWRVEHGRDIIVTDYRKMINIKVQRPVTFLNRVFSKEPVTMPAIDGLNLAAGETDSIFTCS